MPHDSRAKSILLKALETPVGIRRRVIDELCGKDDSLRLEVDELLRYETGGEAGLDDGVGGIIDSDLRGAVGPFVIEHLLGRGGMGEVYLATDQRDGRRVALKILRWIGTSPERRRRFEREAQALGRFEHPGLARLFGSGVLDAPEGPLPYLAMEYVEGRGLREVMELGRGDAVRVIAFMVEIAEILGVAHGRGVVHRDLKPENIIVDTQGRARILDFGVARLEGDGSGGTTLATRLGQIIGTLQYMSPEQAASDGRPVDGRADIYSLGVIAFEWLAGRLPYTAELGSFHQAMVQILTHVPPRLGQVDARLAGGIEQVVARCLAKRPDNRYASAAALREDLGRLQAGEELQPWHPVTDEIPIGAAGVMAPGAGAGGRSRLLGLVSVVIVLGLLVGLAFLTTRENGHKSDSRSDSNWSVFFETLTSADRMVQRSGHTEQAVSQGLTLLQDAERHLPALPRRGYSARVSMFIHWRMGEAHLFLSDLRNDPDELMAASGAWDLAMNDAQRPGSLAEIDSTLTILPEIGRLGRHHPLAGLAGIHSGLVEYRNPVANIENALHFQGRALAAYADSGMSNYDARFGPNKIDRDVDRAMLLADYGAMWARSGYMRERVGQIDTGLEQLARADSAWSYKEYHSPYGAYLHNHGIAYRLRAELAGNLADLDSAEAWFQRALRMRSAAETVSGYAGTKMEQAQVSLAAMRLVDGAGQRAARYRQGLDFVAEARAVLKPGKHAVSVAWLNTIETELHAERARDTRRGADLRSSLDRADSLMAMADTVITRARFAMQRSRYALSLGRLAAARWQRLGDAAARERAKGELRVAVEGTPAAEEPHLRRQLDEVLALLEAPGRGGAGPD